MRDLISRQGLQKEIEVLSRATSYEEEGNGIYPPAQRKLQKEGIEMHAHRARRITVEDAKTCDYIVVMEERNVLALRRIIGDGLMSKVSKLLDYTDNPHDIADPWWTGNFDLTYDEIMLGCKGLLANLTGNERH